jgi:transcriptional regulator with XRE-family HTH domain
MFMSPIIGTPMFPVNRNSNLNYRDNIGMSIGSRIREARKSAKMTQAQLAAKVGMKQGTLSELETGESDGTTLVASFAAALGVNALWLETGKGPKASDHAQRIKDAHMILAYEDEEGLLDLFRRTDDRGRFEIIQLAISEVRRAANEPPTTS